MSFYDKRRSSWLSVVLSSIAVVSPNRVLAKRHESGRILNTHTDHDNPLPPLAPVGDLGAVQPVAPLAPHTPWVPTFCGAYFGASDRSSCWEALYQDRAFWHI